MTNECCNGNCSQGDCPQSRAVSRAVLRALLPGLATVLVVLVALASFFAIVSAGMLVSPSDLVTVLADAAAEPALIVVALLLALMVGVAIGWCLRGRGPDLDDLPDAGDTHAGLPPMRTADWARIERESAQLVATPGTRRVRAGPLNPPPLKPSFDARKQSVRPLHH